MKLSLTASCLFLTWVLISSLGLRGGSDGEGTCGPGADRGRNRCGRPPHDVESALAAAGAQAAVKNEALKTLPGSGGTRNIMVRSGYKLFHITSEISIEVVFV